MASHLTFHNHPVDKILRCELKKQTPCVLWFTGLSGSGKSSIAGAVEKILADRMHHTYLMDGDNIRHGLCSDLGFSKKDRIENIRRIGEVSKLMVDSGLIVLSAFISPFKENRKMVRDLFQETEFIEIFIDTSLSECIKRDPKGLYKQSKQGLIKNLTGIDSPYEAPENPELKIDTQGISINDAADIIINYLHINHYLKK